MTTRRIFILLATLSVLGGCAAQDPFVYREAEFDRTRADFGRDFVPGDSVVICYAGNATTPDRLRELARAACAKAGRKAVFKGHADLVCPMLTPAAAEFSCVQP